MSNYLKNLSVEDITSIFYSKLDVFELEYDRKHKFSQNIKNEIEQSPEFKAFKTLLKNKFIEENNVLIVHMTKNLKNYFKDYSHIVNLEKLTLKNIDDSLYLNNFNFFEKDIEMFFYGKPSGLIQLDNNSEFINFNDISIIYTQNNKKISPIPVLFRNAFKKTLNEIRTNESLLTPDETVNYSFEKNKNIIFELISFITKNKTILDKILDSGSFQVLDFSKKINFEALNEVCDVISLTTDQPVNHIIPMIKQINEKILQVNKEKKLNINNKKIQN